MKHRETWDWYRPAPKLQPPAHGIRMGKAGKTWWGQRWIEALEVVLGGDSARLTRGRTYARAGRTHDLVIRGGVVTAKVTGSSPTPYEITIQLATLADAAWKRAITAMASRAQFAADLLAGQMPKEIDEVFRASGSGLFPQSKKDISTSCSCPDWGDPCKHVAATHYVLGEALDRDPFLLFELRGRTKEQVLHGLRAARSGDVGVGQGGRGAKAKGEDVDARPEVSTVALGTIHAEDYDRPRGELPASHYSFEGPVSHGALLRQLGALPAWSDSRAPADALAALVGAAADLARRIAAAEADIPSESGAVACVGSDRRAGRRPRAGTTRRRA